MLIYTCYSVYLRAAQRQLQRHGARYPNANDDYDTAVKHLLHAHDFQDASLEFLREYDYQLHTDVLVPFGAEQCVLSRFTGGMLLMPE